MNTDATIRGFLEAMALLNAGHNHNCTFTLERLTPQTTLKAALERHFAELGGSPPDGSDWQLALTPVPDIRPLLGKWFFEQKCSPESKSLPERRRLVVERFVTLLNEVLGKHQAFEVSSTPPVFYEISWSDIALSAHDGYWLLHLGMSD